MRGRECRGVRERGRGRAKRGRSVVQGEEWETKKEDGKVSVLRKGRNGKGKRRRKGEP